MHRGSGDWEQLERRGADRELRAEEILRLLIDAGIDFVVIGGFAVIAHGYLRATKDIDIVPRPTAENRDALERALMSIKAQPIEQADIRPDEMPVQWTSGALAHGGNWALQTDYGRIDVLQYIDRVDVVETYVELRDQALQADVPDVGIVRFASLEHLELMKRVAGRPQDINDLAQLENIRAERE
jgi:uncharacterized protein YjhX (UPF0386 family)